MLGGNRHYHYDTKAILPSAENYRLAGLLENAASVLRMNK